MNIAEFEDRIQIASKKISEMGPMVPSAFVLTNCKATELQNRFDQAQEKIQAMKPMPEAQA